MASPSTFAALRNDAIAREMGVTLPEMYWEPRRVENGLKTCRGIVIGGAIAPAKPVLGVDAEHLQAALLEPRTAKPLPLLQRIAGAFVRWC